VRAVMDAAGIARATLLGISEGGPMSVLFASTHRSRVDGLILCGSYARRPVPPGGWEPFLRMVEDRWGTGELFSARAPSALGDDQLYALHARLERQAASPADVAAILRMAAAIDVTEILPAVAVPTLVLHRTDDAVLPSSGGRDLAAGIPNARIVELPGADHLVWMGDGEDIAGEIEEFLTGERHEPEGDRVLTTVLFTDIVGSTERAAELGDRRWRDVLDRHDVVARQMVEQFRGRVVKTTGDGLLATFDGPARGIRGACAIRDGLHDLDVQADLGLSPAGAGVVVRAVDRHGVHIAQRVSDLAHAGEVLVSRTVADLVAGSGIGFEDRGEHELKGVPGRWGLFAVRVEP